jgi:hypothetical protein
METKNREKLLLIATGAAIGLWLLNLLVIAPLTDSWHSRSNEIDKLKTEIADGNRLIQRKSTIHERWDFMRANALNSNPTVAERQLFTAFDRWVKSGGVTQGSFRPQLQDTDSNYMTVDCRSDVTGGPNNVRDFLKAMSKDPLADKLDSFVLTAKDDNGKQLTLDLNLSGLVLTDSVPSLPPGMADATPPARDTNSTANAELNPLDPFQFITRNNIFDQSRFPQSENVRVASRNPKVEAVTYCGAGLDDKVGSAVFDGNGVRTGHDYEVGESILDLKITKITFTDVTMTNAGGNTFHLPVGTSLRREDNGPWRLSAYVAVMPALETVSTTSDSSASSSGSKLDEIIARLKKRHDEAK